MGTEGTAETTGKQEWTYESPIVEDLGSLEEITQKVLGSVDGGGTMS